MFESNVKIHSIDVMNALGQQMTGVLIQENRIDLSTIVSGVYYIRFTGLSGQATLKIRVD